MQESIVYGRIKDLTTLPNDAERRRTNRLAMLTLPQAEDWACLSRDMFSIPATRKNDESYQSEVIHFGASYAGIEYEWKNWMKNFEELLKLMYWVSATVHLETPYHGTHTFQWHANAIAHDPSKPWQNVITEWEQESYFG